MRGKASRSGPGGEIGEAPPAADAARRFRGSAPIGGRDSGRQSVGTTVGKRTPPLRTAWRLVRRADVGIGPYGRFDKKVPAWNPPVTALPCRPSLGKGAVGTGDTDCHDQFANWSRNDTFYKRCGTASAGGQRRPPLRMTRKYVQARERADVGIGPYGRFDKKVPAWNHPVTASPCRPSLGKGPLKTRNADCHDQ